MRTIHKYKLDNSSIQHIHMPRGSRPRSVMMQRDDLYVWCEVDTDQPTEIRTFFVHGTGHPINEAALEYVGSVDQFAGTLIWHVYTT